MSSFMEDIVERASLAGTNKFELLLFKLGADKDSGCTELFGINVFKIREIIAMPKITRMPGTPDHVLGVATLRGQLITVLDLPALVSCRSAQNSFVIITEFERSVQGFAVESIEEIVRLRWDHVLSAEANSVGGLITSLARLEDKEDPAKDRLALVLDVERILHDALPTRTREAEISGLQATVSIPPGSVVLYADDSAVARTQIEKTLDKLNLPHIGVRTGAEALDKLRQMAKEATAAHQSIRDKVALVLSDLEMPEMDGFSLTRAIKNDDTLRAVPVVIHSSLSGDANEDHARKVGAEGYVAKFVPEELARAIQQALPMAA